MKGHRAALQTQLLTIFLFVVLFLGFFLLRFGTGATERRGAKERATEGISEPTARDAIKSTTQQTP